MKLEKLRKKIDEIDKRIISLLNDRIGVAKEIGSIKLRHGEPLYSPEREAQILRRLVKQNKGPIAGGAIKAIYSEIMSSSRAAAAPLRVSYLGPAATFTHLASLKKFGTSVAYRGADSITDVFNDVEHDRANYGVVPIENSIEGAVNHTLDMFIDSDLKICSEVVLEVSHNLLARTRDIKAVKKVYSNPQVFGQCRLWLERNLPRVELVEVSSTSRAAQLAARTRNSACIASELAAELYNLNIIAQDIEDSAHNITRFLVVGKRDSQPTGRDKTSIMFSVKDRVGALHDMLVPFKRYGINLTKIESRPSKRKAWEYYFFVDIQGHKEGAKIKRALGALQKNCAFLKVLGSYPVDE